MLENTPVTFMNCSQIWIVLSVSPRKFLRMLARSSPIRLTLGAGELRLTSLSTFSGRWFWVFQARNNSVIYSAPWVLVPSARTARTPRGVRVHSAWTVWSPTDSVCTPHGLCGVRASPSDSVQNVWSPSQSVQTPHKNCTQQGLNQALNIGTNSNC